MLHRLKSIIKNQTGFSLIELLVALVIASSVTTAATMVIFQVFDGEARSSNHIDAINRVQNVGQRISADTGMAQTWDWTDDGDGFPLTLYWTEWESNDTHEVVYSIVDNTLQRVHSSDEGEVTTVFEFITSIGPDTGELITYCEWDGTNFKFNFTLTAIVGVGSQQQSETRVYEVKPRPSI
jgi:prepilin-type N-terminal cleavage/methylation domain-containing protein